MKYKNIIDKEGIKIFKQLLRDGISGYYNDLYNDHDCIHHVIVSGKGEVYLFTDNPKYIGNEMECSCFKIEKKEYDYLSTSPYLSCRRRINGESISIPFKWNNMNVVSKLNNIYIYRDRARWNYKSHYYDIIADVAIRLLGDNENLLFILRDISGFVSIYRNYTESEDSIINRYWGKKHWGLQTDNLEYRERSIISL